MLFRSSIFKEHLYYQAGVELGKISKLINDYEKYQLGNNYTEQELNEAISIRYAIMLKEIQEKKGVKTAINCIRNYKKLFEDTLFKKKEERDQEMFAWFNEGCERQSIEYLQEQRKRLTILKQELSKDKINDMSELLTLITELTDVDTAEEQKVLRKISNDYQKYIINNTK